MAIIDNGWGSSAICSVENGSLIFSETGLIINEYTGASSENNLTIKADFTYNDVDIGLVLWYNYEVGYIKYALTNQGFSVTRMYKGQEIPLKVSLFSELNSIEAPTTDSSVSLKAEINKTNIKGYFNDVLVFNIEQGTFNNGMFGIYGQTGTICTSFGIETNSVGGWTTHLNDGAITPTKEGLSVYSSGKYTYVSQSVTTSIGEQYTVSIDATDEVKIEIHNGTAVITSDTFAPAEKTELSFTADAVSTEIRIGRETVGKTIISNPQVEHKAFATSYIDGTRERSILKFPSKNMDRYQGGLSMWIEPIHDYTTGTLSIFYYNDLFKLVYSANKFILTYGTETLEMTYSLVSGAPVHIIAAWSNGSDLSLRAHDDIFEDTIAQTSIGSCTIELSDSIFIGCTPDASANVTIDTLVVYSGQLSWSQDTGRTEQMTIYRTEPLPNDNRIVIKTDFSDGMLALAKNKIILPNPKPFTPIMVEDESGTTYERVYFLDNGKYVLYDKKIMPYVGVKTFKVDYDNLLNVKAYSSTKVYEDITVDNGIITIGDLSENDIAVTNELMTAVTNRIYSADHVNWIRSKPVTLKRLVSTDVYENIDSKQYTINYESGFIVLDNAFTGNAILYIDYTYCNIPSFTLEYTPKDSFCAQYNKDYNGYEISISNLYGSPINIIYENDYGAQTKLVTTVEANPFKAANNNGFVYVVSQPVEVVSLDVKVTPDALLADGYKTATITVDCIGKGGTITSNADIVVGQPKYGKIEKYVSDEEQDWIDAFEAEKALNGEDSAIERYGNFVTDEHISGRYVYKYTANNIAIGGEYIENLTIIDNKTGIGTEVSIRVVSKG